jgi:hypothetical protein
VVMLQGLYATDYGNSAMVTPKQQSLPILTA